MLLCVASLAVAQERVGLRLEPDVPASLQAKLESAIRGQLVDVGVLVDADVTCRVVIARVGDELTLRFQDAAARQVGDVRTLSLAAEELAATEAATMVRAFVLTRERDVATTLVEPEPASPMRFFALPPVQEVQVPSVRSRSLGRVSAFYTGNTYASQLRWQRGLRAELALYLRGWLQVGAGYTFHPAVELDLSGARVRLRDHNLSLLAGFGREGARVGIAGDLIVGATDTVRETVQTSGGLVATGESQRWSANTTLRVRVRLRVVSRMWLEFAPALELAFAQRDLATRIGEEATVLSPRAARLRFDVGASFEVP
ncbi:MAG TPA: hypothetical protein VI299_09205 [Polyangiales bacterium]